MPVLDCDTLRDLSYQRLREAGATEIMARAAARDLVLAEMLGQPGHGLVRVPQYANFLRNGRATGTAVPKIVRDTGAAVLVDAGGGLAFSALDLATQAGVDRAHTMGVSLIAVSGSHHAGALCLPVERAANQGYVALAFSNTPPAIAAPGGRRPIFGTNPIAAGFPCVGVPPVVIDMALSNVARSRVIVAAREGRDIPDSWAVDADGNPTTDPKQGLLGSMVAIGGAKGALLAATVEVLCCGLTGARLSKDVDTFDRPDGNHPMLGQVLLFIAPSALAGSDIFESQLKSILGAMLEQPGTRLPGARRQELLKRAQRDGVKISEILEQQLSRPFRPA